MPGVELIERSLFWVSIPAYLALYWRLRHEGLHRTYRVFSAYLVFHAARSATLAGMPVLWSLFRKGRYVHFGNDVYGWFWVLTEPILWVFYILLLLELYSLVFRNYRGITSLSRWAILAGLIVAIVLSALTLPADLSNSAERFPILRGFLAVEHGLASSLVVFLLSITAFLVWFPVPLNRNVVLHSLVYAIYFVTVAMSLLLRDLRGSTVTSAINLAYTGVDLVCVALWIALLNRAGEAVKATVRHAWDPERQEFLMKQLEAINSTLLRSGPKQ
jgi:hypothetical protein